MKLETPPRCSARRPPERLPGRNPHDGAFLAACQIPAVTGGARRSPSRWFRNRSSSCGWSPGTSARGWPCGPCRHRRRSLCLLGASFHCRRDRSQPFLASTPEVFLLCPFAATFACQRDAEPDGSDEVLMIRTGSPTRSSELQCGRRPRQREQVYRSFLIGDFLGGGDPPAVGATLAPPLDVKGVSERRRPRRSGASEAWWIDLGSIVVAAVLGFEDFPSARGSLRRIWLTAALHHQLLLLSQTMLTRIFCSISVSPVTGTSR